jgi:hypothetical protein
MVMRWFKAASPYATPGSLEEGLKRVESQEEAIVEMIRRIGVKSGIDGTVYGAMCHEIRCIVSAERLP